MPQNYSQDFIATLHYKPMMDKAYLSSITEPKSFSTTPGSILVL